MVLDAVQFVIIDEFIKDSDENNVNEDNLLPRMETLQTLEDQDYSTDNEEDGFQIDIKKGETMIIQKNRQGGTLTKQDFSPMPDLN